MKYRFDIMHVNSSLCNSKNIIAENKKEAIDTFSKEYAEENVNGIIDILIMDESANGHSIYNKNFIEKENIILGKLNK